MNKISINVVLLNSIDLNAIELNTAVGFIDGSAEIVIGGIPIILDDEAQGILNTNVLGGDGFILGSGELGTTALGIQ